MNVGRLIVIGMCCAAVGVVSARQSGPAAAALESARLIAVVDGDLPAAIAQYQAVVTQYGTTDRAAAAQALVRIAESYEKLGDARSQAAYARILREFGDQAQVAARARARLGPSAQAGPVAPAQVFCEGCGGEVADGSFSRDGQWLATTDYESGDIVVRHVATKQVTRLYAKANSFRDWVPTNGAIPPGDSDYLAYGPLLSPDGHSVAYTWNVSGQSPRARDIPTELRVMARSGGTARTLLKNSEFEWSRAVAWSPDGERVLAALRRPDKTWQLAWVSVDNGQVATLKSLDWRLIGGGDRDVSLSPDGRLIAYAALARNPDKAPPAVPASTERHLYVLASDASGEAEITKTTAADGRPMWTPDGNTIVFTSDRAGSHDLWALPMRDGKPAGAPSIVSRDIGFPLAMLDSGVLLSLDGTAAVPQVIVGHLDTAGRMPADVRLTDTFVGARPSWSPDAKTLQFTRGRVMSSPGGVSFDVVLRAMDTGVERLIPRTGARRPVEWLHDGSGFLTVTGPASPVSRLNTTGTPATTVFHAIDLPRGTSREVLRNGTPVAVLSPDDKTLYQFGRDPGQQNVANRLVAVDIATGRERIVRSLPGEPGTLPRLPGGVALALTPDGRTLAFLICSTITFGGSRPGMGQVVTSGGDCRLSAVSVDGTGHRDVFGPFKGGIASDRLAWTGNGGAILFASRDGMAGECGVSSCLFRLMRVSADGGRPEFTGLEMDLGAQGIFAVSADGTRVAFDTTVPETNNVIAIDLSRLSRKP
jgi:Tol biopolymer transport system component